MKVRDPLLVDLSAEQLQAWRARMEERLLAFPDAAADLAILQALLDAYRFLVATLSATRVSIRRLKRWLFGSQSEKRDKIFPPGPTSPDSGDAGASEGAGNTDGKKKGPKPKRKGHGRNGVAAYPGARRVLVPHPTFFPGTACPHGDCGGKVYPLKTPRVVLRVFGQPMFTATVWERARWRCHLCEEVFVAPDPPEATGPKYDVSAVVMIGLLRFGNGFASNRLEQHQQSLGVPLPASVQSELLSGAFETLSPVFQELIRQAAQFEVLHNDDTGMKVLAILAQIKAQTQDPSGPKTNRKGRTGIHTTAIVAVSLSRDLRIALYFTGTRHAGENLARLLEHRDPALPAPIHESDGLDHNRPGKLPVMSGKCLTHGRRQFVDVISSFPDECRHVVEALARVYRVDAITKEKQLSPEDRLLLHQEKSGPIMEALRRWLTDQLLESVEPNSALGRAIKYMLKLWEPLTLFLRQPGAPLDNNIAERVLKKAIRHRKNSLFFKTERGAAVGDLFMSIIETCALNRVNSFEYLVALLSHAERIEDSPSSWMPWNYQAMLRDTTTTDHESAPRRTGTENPTATTVDRPASPVASRSDPPTGGRHPPVVQEGPRHAERDGPSPSREGATSGPPGRGRDCRSTGAAGAHGPRASPPPPVPLSATR